MNRAVVAGVLLFLAILQFLIFLRVSESIYPGYSVSGNFVSDLGVGPAAPVFNTSIILLGVLVMVSSYLLYGVFGDILFMATVFLAGFGALGVGVFPEGSPYGLHTIMSFITFLFAGVAAISAYRVARQPLRTISIALGILTLAALILFASGTYLGLGHGGMERMIVYPPLIWALVFSGYLMMLKPEK
jgi:hypothetical membrane protein